MRERGDYIPGSAISGTRHEWPRMPFLPKAYGCYLCGSGFDSHRELVCHWKQSHLTLAADHKDALGEARVEEEIRKRLFFEECFEGPFEVRGQEHRRIIGRHAYHQTHSIPGAGGRDHGLKGTTGRSLSGCAICARSKWVEDL